jgi:predicted ester cyclase
MKTHPLLVLVETSLAVAFFLAGTACRSSRTEHQRLLIEKYAAFWNTGEADGAEVVLHPDFEIRYCMEGFRPSSVKGIEAFRKEMARVHAQALSLVLDEAVYGTDTITLRWTFHATYSDGAGGTPMTAHAKGISLIHLKDGRIADEWMAYDRKALMEERGYEMKRK